MATITVRQPCSVAGNIWIQTVAIDKRIESAELDAFMYQHRLPGSYLSFIKSDLLAFVSWLKQKRQPDKILLLGINGAQGTGKSTMAEAISLLCSKQFGWNTAILSIDDIYLTRNERIALAEKIHPLLLTRGVPGTHDVALGLDIIRQLKRAGADSEIKLPRFNKAGDERLNRSQWPSCSGPVDLILFEGWCVGSTAQAERELTQPINELEAREDADGQWRHYVNRQLAEYYQPLFKQIDLLLFLNAPGFDVVHGWRSEQEEKLAEASVGEHLMNETQITRFIQHYERLTRHNLEVLPSIADVVFDLDADHAIIKPHYKEDAKK